MWFWPLARASRSPRSRWRSASRPLDDARVGEVVQRAHSQRSGEQAPIVEPPRDHHRFLRPVPVRREVAAHQASGGQLQLQQGRRCCIGVDEAVQLAQQHCPGFGVPPEQPVHERAEPHHLGALLGRLCGQQRQHFVQHVATLGQPAGDAERLGAQTEHVQSHRERRLRLRQQTQRHLKPVCRGRRRGVHGR
jgi:hypothetical protein